MQKGSRRYQTCLANNKTKESITSQNLGSLDFWWITIVFNKIKSVTLPVFINGPEVLSFVSDKAKLLAENFSKNSNLNGSGISRTNPKLQNIPLTPESVKKGQNQPWFVKGIWSWFQCKILYSKVVLEKCESELS